MYRLTKMNNSSLTKVTIVIFLIENHYICTPKLHLLNGEVAQLVRAQDS